MSPRVMHPAKYIAARFRLIKQPDKPGLTEMQISRLVYIAHGWALGIFGLPLIEDEIHAMASGPIILAMNHVEPEFGPHRSESGQAASKNALATWERALIDAVYESYKAYSGYQLSLLTQASGSPWDSIWNNGLGKNAVIPDSLIREHYIKIACNKARVPVVA